MAVPTCYDGTDVLNVNVPQILEWKQNTPNQFKARGHIVGKVMAMGRMVGSHTHIGIRIGNGSRDTIELIYNDEFGSLPNNIKAGAKVEACGDYITSYAPSGHYPASPEGAILHWVHINPKNSGHEDGYFAIDGEVFGDNP